MISRRKLVLASASAAAVAAVAVPLGLTQGGGTVDVFVGSTPTPTATATPTATPFSTANAWVDTNGGTCTYQSTAGAYSDAAACSTVDAAWDLVSAGQRVCIRTGTYSTQIVTGNKASSTTITGNCGGAVTIGPGSGTVTCTGLSGPGADATICPDATNITLDSVTIDVSTANDVSSAARINAANTTFTNVTLIGSRPQIFVTASNFLWDGGTHGVSGGSVYDCFASGQPTQIDSGSMTIQNVRWNPKTITGGTPNTGNCGEDGNPHLEYTRIQCNCAVTLKNNFYALGGAPGSGYIFSGISTSLDNLDVIGNYFADADVSYYMQAGNLAGCTGWDWLYNTFDDGDVGGAIGGITSGSCSAITTAGNLGMAPGACTVHVKNVVRGSGTCGSDTFIGSTDLGVTSTTGRLETGSPGIDGGETAPGTYCGGADVGGTDREGGTRGTGGVCDAGADER